MAEDIISKCKYIHPSRIEEIEQLLIKLRKYTLSAEAKGSAASVSSANTEMAVAAAEDRESKRKGADRSEVESTAQLTSNRPILTDEDIDVERADRQKLAALEDLPPSKLGDIDDYLEMLYEVSGKSEKEREESLRQQIRGTGMILQLCRDVLNLEQLIQNGTVMGALTRVLQDEHKKSIELTFNILRIFLAFSNFSEMHRIMTNYKIGAITMKVLITMQSQFYVNAYLF